VSEERRSQGGLAQLAAGLIIGAVEVVLAVAFAALVFAGATPSRLGDGIGLYLVAAALTLGFLRGAPESAASWAACRTPRRPCSRSWR
jgi:hypothetical protein